MPDTHDHDSTDTSNGSFVSRDTEVAKEVLKTEADALLAMAETIGADFSAAVDKIIASEGRMICVGIGKSGHIARKIAATLSSTGTAAYYVHPAEASHGDLGMIQTNDIVLALSRSGETTELGDLIQYTRRFGVSLIGMTAAPQSALGKASDILLQIPKAAEACSETKAPTTSTTLMLALGDALAVALLRRRTFDASNFKDFHPGGKLGAMLKTARDLMHVGDAVPLIAAGSNLSEGIAEITEKGFGCVGIVDTENKLIGILTDGDLRRLLVAPKQAETVDAAMTPNPITARAEDLAGTLLQTLNDRKVTQLFITENNLPIGIVHMHDVLKAGLI